jgi:pyridoxamine 5'-phosphate oxidase
MAAAGDDTGRVRDDSLDDPLPASPLPTLSRWLREARASELVRNHDAMALATVDGSGAPRVRLVLCRRFDADRGTFFFYTNRESPKAHELERAGRTAGVFYWDALGRQARIEGVVERTSDRDSDAYFAGRHRASQIAAWASAQSRPIASRDALEIRFEEAAARVGGGESEARVVRPPHWGGYVISADRVELWVERPGRLHDRGVWTRALERTAGPEGDALEASAWQVERLQP